MDAASPIALVAFYALIGGLFTAAAPLVLTWLTGRQLAQKEARDEARQNRTNERADEIARRLLSSNEQIAAKAAEASALLLESNDKIANSVKTTDAKLGEIKVYVDGNYTASLQASLDAKMLAVTLMRELIDLKQAAGSPPTAEAQAAIRSTTTEIDALRLTLEDRKNQVETAAITARNEALRGGAAS